MGAVGSKQLAERIIIACGQFKQQLADLEIPAPLRQLVRDQAGRKRHEYGKKEIEHRAFRTLWVAPAPKLHSDIRRALYNGHKNPSLLFQDGSKNLCQESLAADYLDYLYELDQSRQVNALRWRLSLIPLLEIFNKFDLPHANTETYNHLFTLISESSLSLKHKDEIRVCLPIWVAKSKRYNTLVKELGPGSVCVLPDIGDSIWEKYLPIEGPVHTACIKLLLDRGIKQTASVTVDDGGNITVDTATQTILEYLRSLLNKISFLHSATQQQRRGWGGPSQVASSEACANEQTTRPRQDRTTQQTQAKRRRLNAVLSEQHSAQSQNGLIHRSQDVQSWTEGIVHGSDPANIHPEV
ncbi:hypothetical protein TEQG_05663 [Trichophyton equinum CBS 127.97]|uniref:Uncharacterized protein n=1 Tax=Trichophyton equinum (strain ATCC MYA-4606 / CBS 127.97) TaxID=559882 RepID=F2PXP8_TRIEC|nr:hypothetical protein TEQG_05663 [Trichophyton equinum CBS 127.97]